MRRGLKKKLLTFYCANGMKYKIIFLLLIFLLGVYMDKIYNEEEANNKIEKIYECEIYE